MSKSFKDTVPVKSRAEKEADKRTAKREQRVQKNLHKVFTSANDLEDEDLED